jgi:hypothetical protein
MCMWQITFDLIWLHPQVQMIPAGTATAQVVQQKLLQQQVVTAAASPQIQTPPPHSPAQQASVSAAAESPVQQQPAKGQAHRGAMRGKTQAKPSGGSSLVPTGLVRAPLSARLSRTSHQCKCIQWLRSSIMKRSSVMKEWWSPVWGGCVESNLV